MKDMQNNLIPGKEIEAVFSCLNKADITYALKTNNGDELPDHLPDGKDIDLLVAPEDTEKLNIALNSIGFHRVAAFKGKENGYRFAYGLSENMTYEKKLSNGRLYLDADYALMCLSLQPKIWIPLDRTINQEAFTKRVFNKKLNCWELDDEIRLIYLLVRCVFDKHKFTDVYITEIEKRIHLINYQSFSEKLQKIFFQFTPELIRLLKTKDYNSIYHTYITFRNY